MGNFLWTPKQSADKEFKNFYEIVDYISTYYILTADFKSLRKLTEKEYCDKLIVVTADIIKNNFNNNDIMFLAQRIKGGLEVNEMTTENYTYVTQDKLNDLDVRNDLNKDIKKKRVCIGIAKFYIKIAHVFASIVMTINPTYTYKNETGQTVEVGMMEKDKIPVGVERTVNKYNICDNRIRALKRGLDENSVDGMTTMNPKICDINLSREGSVKSLADEPGISQLDKLYYDDIYDYSSGTFTGMSEATKRQYRKDLEQFYKAFSGKEGELPPEITKFSEILLRDYSKKQGCQTGELLKQKITLSKNEKVFMDYANHLKNTIQRAADNQSKLLTVINSLFSYVKDPYTGKTRIRVNPKLTDSLLQQNVELTRSLIIRLYVQCEMDYLEGVKLYEVIIQSKIYEITGKRINNLKMEANKLLDESRNAMKPVENKPMFNRPPPVQETESTETSSDSSSEQSSEPTNPLLGNPLLENPLLEKVEQKAQRPEAQRPEAEQPNPLLEKMEQKAQRPEAERLEAQRPEAEQPEMPPIARPNMPPMTPDIRPVMRPDVPPFARPDVPPMRPDVPPMRLDVPPIRPDVPPIRPDVPPVRPDLNPEGPPMMRLEMPAAAMRLEVPAPLARQEDLPEQPFMQPAAPMQPPAPVMQPNNRPIIEPVRQPGTGVYMANV